MAVQQNKATRSRRGKRRSHDSLSKPTLSIEPMTGETHRRHHVSSDGGWIIGRQAFQFRFPSISRKGLELFVEFEDPAGLIRTVGLHV